MDLERDERELLLGQIGHVAPVALGPVGNSVEIVSARNHGGAEPVAQEGELVHIETEVEVLPEILLAAPSQVAGVVIHERQ